jgi:hypothetical protein
MSKIPKVEIKEKLGDILKKAKEKKHIEIPKKEESKPPEIAVEKKPPEQKLPEIEKPKVQYKGIGEVIAGIFDSIFSMFKIPTLTKEERESLKNLLDNVVMVETKQITLGFDYALALLLLEIFGMRATQFLEKMKARKEEEKEKKEKEEIPKESGWKQVLEKATSKKKKPKSLEEQIASEEEKK